jgi:hypothetical protein
VVAAIGHRRLAIGQVANAASRLRLALNGFHAAAVDG